MGRSLIARRRRHARYRREDEEAYYEKSAHQHSVPGDSGLEEADASMTNVMTPASADAYPDRQIHFGGSVPQIPEAMYTPQNYGIEYPPETNHHQAVAQGERLRNAQIDDRQSHPSSRFIPGHVIANPHNGNSARLASPVIVRGTPEYDQLYETTAGSSHAI